MCLISVAAHCSDEYPFIFVGNRDEYHARPSSPADWWQDAPTILGGRDQVAGGSWLGINKEGAFAVVTNRPDLHAPEHQALSRGALVADRLNSRADDALLDNQLRKEHQRYGGFSLLSGSINPSQAGQLTCHSGGNGISQLQSQPVLPGVFGLSNTAVEQPWPKLSWLNSELLQLLKKEPLQNTAPLFALLLRQTPVADQQDPWVATLPFIPGDEYGTRCATVITVDRDGNFRFHEKRFGPEGIAAGESLVEGQFS